MSKTTSSNIKESPCKKYLQWKSVYKITTDSDGDEIKKLVGGNFTFYDKVTEENVPVKLPFRFAVIEPDTFNFKGYNETTKQGAWSNEVRNRRFSEGDKNMVVTIRNKDGKLYEFKAGDSSKVKDKLKSLSVKRHQSVYIVVDNEGEFEIWNLQLKGSQLSGGVDLKSKDFEDRIAGWFGFTQVYSDKLYDNWIEINKSTIRSNDAMKFSVPVYKLGEPISAEDNEKIVALDKAFQEYFEWYITKPVEVKKEEDEDAPDDYPVDWDSVKDED
jgi:hypothetical protein